MSVQERVLDDRRAPKATGRERAHCSVSISTAANLDDEDLCAAALDEAVWGLKRRQPADSAYWVILPAQAMTCVALILLLGVAFFWAPLWTLAALILVMSGLNLAIAGFRFALALIAPDAADVADAGSGPEPEVWPFYSVMVPLFREAHVAPKLARAMQALDYPADRIEVFFVCEADDIATVAAAEGAIRHDARFRVIRVPPCQPRTKPKALNYALCFTRGDLTVIFDAEDMPDRDQLRKAALRFLSGPRDLACLQARLNWYNRDQNWLTRAFALEYALWFDYLLPGLERLGAPIPLGGTSNHFKTDALVRCGGWDPFNVTEDADLGLRLMRLGALVGTLDSTTLEEATSSIRAWTRQRSRWIKGYMQTWLVQMRAPSQIWTAAGAAGFFSFQLFVGGVIVTALVNPWLWALSLACVVAWALNVPNPVGDQGAVWALTSLVLGNASLVYLNMLCVLRRRWIGLTPAALGTPLYWALISIAGYRALAQLIVNPFYWEKTEHGAGGSTT